jgi:hypothetical protein
MGRTTKRTDQDPLPLRRQGGRVPGAKNIHQPTLYNLVQEHRPLNSVMWDVVANQYRAKTGELSVRPDLKKYFWHKMCNGGKMGKPTGRSAPEPFMAKCQNLYNSILASEEVSDMGDEDVEDSQDPSLTLGQPSQTPFSPTQMVEDSQDPDYHPTLEDDFLETSDSEDEVVARRDTTPSTVTSAIPKNVVSRSLSNTKSKNAKHTVNQGMFRKYIFIYLILFVYIFIGRQNIGKGLTDLIETVKETSSSSSDNSSLMMFFAAQETARRSEIEERRKEREAELEERRKERREELKEREVNNF